MLNLPLSSVFGFNVSATIPGKVKHFLITKFSVYYYFKSKCHFNFKLKKTIRAREN